EIARSKNSSEEILPFAFAIDQRTDSRAFNRNKWSELLQSLRGALNTQWRGVNVEKPVAPAASASAPKRAPGGRDVNSRADTVADHGDIRRQRNNIKLWSVAPR